MRQTPHLRARRLLASAAAMALVLTACGGDDGETEATEEATATGATASEAEPTGEMTTAAAGGEVAIDVGVTAEACPEAVNPDNGCIYLGAISDLTEGPFQPLAVPITAAQEAFWNRVNEDGGIGGAYDVNISEYTRDNKYNPEVHNQVYQEIKPNILALAQTLGSPTTAAIIDDMIASDIIGAPASWTSLWDTEDPGTNILESGNPYCIESMNALDWHVENGGTLDSVVAVHHPGDYGEDGAAGAKLGAEANGAEFSHVEIAATDSGSALQGAVDAIVQGSPDVVVLSVGPSQLAEIVGGAAAQGYQGRVFGNGPTWNGALLDSAAAPALEAMYILAAPWANFESDTPGHQAMRDALGDDVVGNEGYTSGWAWSYPMLAALEQAYVDGDLTRAGLLNAIGSLDAVDYEGMLPPEAGNFSGSANDQIFRGTVFGEPDAESVSGITTTTDFYTGPTATDFTFEGGACYETIDLDG